MVLRTIDELALQLGSLRDGVALAGFWLAVGVLVTTYQSRRIDLSRVIAGLLAGRFNAAWARIAAAPALLTAALMLLQAATHSAALAATAGAEEWRERIVVGTTLTQTLAVSGACAPLCVATAACGAAAAAAFAALLRWEDLSSPRASISLSAGSSFAGGLLLGMIAILALGSLRLAAFAALFAPLAAALIAASERTVPPAMTPAGSGVTRPAMRRAAALAAFAVLAISFVVVLFPQSRARAAPRQIGILASGLAVADCELTPVYGASSEDSIWRIDLAGPRFDAIHIATTAEETHPVAIERQERRALRRAIRALVPNSRLLFDADALPLARYASTATGRPLFRIDLASADGSRIELLAVGRDVREWVALRCAGTAWTGDVEAIPATQADESR